MLFACGEWQVPIFPRRTHYQRQFPAYGDVVVLGAVFQAMGISAYSMIISMIGRLVVLLPVAYVLAKMFGLMSIWRGVPDCRGRFIHRYDGFYQEALRRQNSSAVHCSPCRKLNDKNQKFRSLSYLSIAGISSAISRATEPRSPFRASRASPAIA